MWGKWAQNQNKTQITLVTSVKELYELFTSTEVTNLIFPNDDVVWVSSKYSEDSIDARKNVKVAVSAYVTTQARLELCEYHSELGSLYFSVIRALLSMLRM